MCQRCIKSVGVEARPSLIRAPFLQGILGTSRESPRTDRLFADMAPVLGQKHCNTPSYFNTCILIFNTGNAWMM
ncbi:hypothetical protein JG687_00005369 [Phytophthora cactorum]|uniref:Uncharacterized protein n=1 Tax=Phytophthora cactorum TaxID=29920 RepID=A0A8T1UMB5_9STRA|nr:hypothetical protein JG687_00005369 [Phytophthora cactorum]